VRVPETAIRRRGAAERVRAAAACLARFAATCHDFGHFGAKIGDELAHGFGVRAKFGTTLF
jgi:hypothetical protein